MLGVHCNIWTKYSLKKNHQIFYLPFSPKIIDITIDIWCLSLDGVIPILFVISAILLFYKDERPTSIFPKTLPRQSPRRKDPTMSLILHQEAYDQITRSLNRAFALPSLKAYAATLNIRGLLTKAVEMFVGSRGIKKIMKRYPRIFPFRSTWLKWQSPAPKIQGKEMR